MMICLTTSVGAFRSIRRLWILISYVSQVLEPSPQGLLRVVTLRFLVGMRTGPLTRSSLLLERSMSSWQTFSSEATLRLVRVIRILWILGWSSWEVFLGSWKDMLGGVGGGRIGGIPSRVGSC